MDFNNFQPCYLIAMPELQDENFHKSVILLTDYNKDGASGFIINRMTTLRLGDSVVLSDGSLNPDYEDLCLSYGGPVDPQKIWIVYDENIFSNPKDTFIGDDIMIAQDIDILINHENTIENDSLRIFHGYSGWGPQQLDNEIASSTWITAPLSRELLFDTPIDQIWNKAVQNLGFDPNKLVGPKSPFLN